MWYSPENGIQVYATFKTHFSCPPDRSLRPPFQNFSVPQNPTFAWNHKFLEKKIASQSLKIRGKVQFKSLKFGQTSVPGASGWTKINSSRSQRPGCGIICWPHLAPTSPAGVKDRKQKWHKWHYKKMVREPNVSPHKQIIKDDNVKECISIE